MEPKKVDKTEAEKSKKNQNFPLLNFNHIQRFSIVIITTLVIVLGMTALGYWLDKMFDTKPWLMAITLILSFPIAQLAVYRKMKQYTKKELKRLNVKPKS